ncbi:MAG: SLC13 family permease [Candidatus Heteroscillospira sp.]|jgi:Na+/H+ antiporter NhaD/arsenite permease-like protein
MLPAVILFALTYLLMLALPRFRAHVALVSAACFIFSGMLPFGDVVGSIDFNVIMMIAGTMGIVSLFIESRMPMLLADIIIEKTPNVRWAIVALALFAGIISAFVDNVATVLMVAPVALAIAKRLDLSPVPMIISIAVSSNLQGAATLVGDTTSILLGGYANMNFIDFFVYQGKMGMFFIVQIGAVISAIVLLWLFRKESSPIVSSQRAVVTDYFPSILLLGMIVLLIIASFLPNMPSCINGLICDALLLIGLLRSVIKTGSLKVVGDVFKEIDWQTILLLTGLFMVIGGIRACGVIDALAQFIAGLGNGNVFIIYTIIVWASVLLSAFIDNIPYVATMLPVAQGIAASMGIDPTLLYFGLLSGATLGGNLTPIGASANIAGIGILRKAGFEVKNTDFLRIGIPFTLSAVIPAYIIIWLLFA